MLTGRGLTVNSPTQRRITHARFTVYSFTFLLMPATSGMLSDFKLAKNFVQILRKFKHLTSSCNFYVLLTVHLSIILDNDQRDTHLLYFTIYLLHSSTCFEHYMLETCRGM